METNIQNSKKGTQDQIRTQIRTYFKNKRNSMTPALVHELSEQISDQILAWKVYRDAKEIYFYYPLGNEVSLLPVIYDSLSAGKRIAFPKVDADQMAFYEISDLSQLNEGYFHVMEPVTTEKQQADWQSALCFVPGTAFDRKGGRFGYGRGYYDRFFADKGSCILVGCAYECQITDTLPVDVWDRRMDYLVSECSITHYDK